MQQIFDLLIRNASIVDGTSAPRFNGDIGIIGDRIVRIGDLSSLRGELEIDLAGRIAAPGFIDSHTHDDRIMLSSPDMAPKVSQGVTTIIGGNCGVSLAPMPRPIPNPVTPPLNLLDDQGSWFHFPTFASYLQELRENPAATNCAMLVGHTTLRVATMNDLSQPASITMPSIRSACMTVSTLSAMISRDTSEKCIPSCPMEIPSETEMVPNCSG
jgi:N-acyl-D-amino-acid deacylase